MRFSFSKNEECSSYVQRRKTSWERTTQRGDAMGKFMIFMNFHYSNSVEGKWNLLQPIVSLCFVCSLNPLQQQVEALKRKKRNRIKLTIKTALKTSWTTEWNTTISSTIKWVSLWKGLNEELNVETGKRIKKKNEAEEVERV